MDNNAQKSGFTKRQLLWSMVFVVVVIVTALGFMVMAGNREAADTVNQENKPTNAVEEYNPGTKVEEPQQPPLEQPKTTNEKAHTITYTSADCYEPASRTVDLGDTVTFTNNDTNDEYMWPASDNHPSHTKYPEFDAKRAIPSGSTYSFTFTKKGTWTYHDHLMSSCSGTITVQ